MLLNYFVSSNLDESQKPVSDTTWEKKRAWFLEKLTKS
jgi:hypothetical protein